MTKKTNKNNVIDMYRRTDARLLYDNLKIKKQDIDTDDKNRLVIILQHFNITGKELAFKIDIPYICIRNWCNGWPHNPGDGLKRIADHLKINIEWLETGKGKMLG